MFNPKSQVSRDEAIARFALRLCSEQVLSVPHFFSVFPSFYLSTALAHRYLDVSLCWIIILILGDLF